MNTNQKEASEKVQTLQDIVSELERCWFIGDFAGVKSTLYELEKDLNYIKMEIMRQLYVNLRKEKE